MFDDVVVNAVAGGLSGITVDFILFPLDTVKTRLQARKVKNGQYSALRNAQGKLASKQSLLEGSSQILHSVKVALRTVEARGFYQGLVSAMMGSFPAAATFWTAYEASKRFLEPYVSRNNTVMLPVVHMLSASVAEVAVCAVRNPFEVVKQQLQTGYHKGTIAAVKNIVRIDGIRGLFAGYWSTVLREIPFDAIEFALYEFLKRKLMEYKQKDDLVLWENCILGSTAGAIAAGVTTPLDVVKTRLMTQTKFAQEDRYVGIRHAMLQIVKEEGVKTLFSGVRQRVIWIGFGGTIFFGTYEECKRRLQSQMKTTRRKTEEWG